jgi:uncharacterized protein YdeI (YjbR/CyaY-like superfamily)
LSGSNGLAEAASGPGDHELLATRQVQAIGPAGEVPLVEHDWLEANHDRSPGIWLMIAKKGSGAESVTYHEAVDEGLCFGWIDGQRAKLDDEYFLQLVTRRTKRSPWSKINTERVARLVKAKRMHPAGAGEVAAAKADGRWDAAYAGQASAVAPEDLQLALDASPAAAALFVELDSASRSAILYRIGSVKKADTRARKIAGFVADLEAQRRVRLFLD